MSGIKHHHLLGFVWICIYQNLNLEPLTKTYCKRQLVLVAYLEYLWWMNLLLNIFVGFSNIQIPVVERNGPYIKAALLISRAYTTLLLVNARYICAVFIPIIELIFISALYLVVNAKENSESREGKHSEAKKAENVDTASNGNGNDGDGDDNGLSATAVVSGSVLCCMRSFNVDNLVVSQFLLFLTSTISELALMMARLPSKEVAAGFQIIRRASLIVVLTTAYTMAAELLGEHAVLACTPVLLTALVWFSIYFGHCGGCSTSATVIIGMVTSRKARFFVFFTVVVPIMAWIAKCSNGSETEMHLLSTFTSTTVSCSFFMILPSLCVLALRQWPKTTEEPSSELVGAIQLLSFCRDIMIISATSYLVLTILLDVRPRLQAQRIDLWAEIVNTFVNSSA